MREILFRGKFSDTKWVYGDLIQDYEYLRILEYGERLLDSYIVYPKSVGQYTGIDGKNGEKVFEGDILKIKRKNGEQYIGEVVWDSGNACFDMLPHVKGMSTRFGAMKSNEFEIIGNKFDNPELLEA